MNCRNCEHDKLHTDYFSGDQYHFCRKYLDNIDHNKANKCKDYKAKTRGDKIRSMTDEELAEFLEGDYGNFETGKAILWLKQSVEGE